MPIIAPGTEGSDMERRKHFATRVLDAVGDHLRSLSRSSHTASHRHRGGRLLGKEQSQHLDHICYNLFAAFADNARSELRGHRRPPGAMPRSAAPLITSGTIWPPTMS